LSSAGLPGGTITSHLREVLLHEVDDPHAAARELGLDAVALDLVGGMVVHQAFLHRFLRTTVDAGATSASP
jgi:hypothetical protein